MDIKYIWWKKTYTELSFFKKKKKQTTRTALFKNNTLVSFFFEINSLFPFCFVDNRGSQKREASKHNKIEETTRFVVKYYVCFFFFKQRDVT